MSITPEQQAYLDLLQSQGSTDAYNTFSSLYGAQSSAPAAGTQPAAGTPWFDNLQSQYQSLLGRPMDASGMEYWRGLDSGTAQTDQELQAQFLAGVQQELAGRKPQSVATSAAPSAAPGGDWATGGYGDYTQSPYMTGMADDIGRRTQLGLGDAFNQIRSNAVGVGGLGGSRQEVAQGVATGRAMDSLQGQLAGLYNADYQSSQNRGLQRYGIDQQTALGNRGLDVTMRGQDIGWQQGVMGNDTALRGQDMSMYNTNRSLDLQQLGLGADIFDMGVKGGWEPLTTAGGLFNTTAGNSVTTTSGGTQGGGWGGAAGGLLAGGSLAQQAGWWNPWK